MFHQMSSENMSGHSSTGLPFQVTFAPNSFTHSPGAKKRRVDENIDVLMKENICSGGPVSSHQRQFITVPSESGVFQTEEWKEKQTPMYHPITDSLLINTKNIEQFSFTTGSWFLADQSGNYCGSREGNIINLWRYDEQQKKLYVSRSMLFTDNFLLYHTIRRQLEEL